MTVSKITSPPSQKAVVDKINEVIDNMAGTITVDQTYDGTSTNPQSGAAIEGAKFLQNKATGTSSITIGGYANSNNYGVNIGYTSSCTASGGIAIGENANVTNNWAISIGGYSDADGYYSISLGTSAEATASRAIQIGSGTNSTANSLQIGFGSSDNYQLLDGTTGLIPDARISTNIARTSDIPAAQVNSDWNANSGVAEILNKPSLSTVATSGDYSDLINTPTIDQTFDKTSANAQSGVSILGLLEAIYPVGAIYIGTTATCPMSALFGTWTLVSSGKALWTGDGTNADTTIAAGLPQIYGEMTSLMCGGVPTYAGAISPRGSGKGATASNVDARRGIYFYASSSNSIYGSSTTVQPPAYVVNVWKRTA